jgi:hypothetical protein
MHGNIGRAGGGTTLGDGVAVPLRDAPQGTRQTG